MTTHRRISRFLLGAIVWLVALSPAWSASEPDYRALGHDHYFNLEYDEAIADYRRALEKTPGDPTVYNHIATSILYKELHRLGMLETSAFKGDNKFLEQEKPDPDPAVKDEFDEVLDKGKALAESILDEDPDDAMALYALSNNYALRANYQFMIEKKYLPALRNGNRASKFSRKLRKKHPAFVDAYLVAGVQQYVLGSLPWPVKILIAFGGMHGNKKKGEEWVTRVAQEGERARHQARALLVILMRREKRPLKAAELLEGLIVDFPRNYVLRLELGAMYEDAGQHERALETFRDIRARYEREEPGYGRMPQRAIEALDRKIEKLESRLREEPTQQAGTGTAET